MVKLPRRLDPWNYFYFIQLVNFCIFHRKNIKKCEIFSIVTFVLRRQQQKYLILIIKKKRTMILILIVIIQLITTDLTVGGKCQTIGRQVQMLLLSAARELAFFPSSLQVPAIDSKCQETICRLVSSIDCRTLQTTAWIEPPDVELRVSLCKYRAWRGIGSLTQVTPALILVPMRVNYTLVWEKCVTFDMLWYLLKRVFGFFTKFNALRLDATWKLQLIYFRKQSLCTIFIYLNIC